jgi:hypothetical protein
MLVRITRIRTRVRVRVTDYNGVESDSGLRVLAVNILGQ